MVDSHCHLTDPRLLEQLDDVLARAAAVGVSRVISIGTNPADDVAVIELCRARPDMLRCAIGVHPNYCHEVDESEIPKLRELQSDPCVVALGEMGLDYHYDFADRARQRRFFEAQLALADDLNRPVVIHCRDAVDDCLAILRIVPRVRAVFHCFTGTIDEADRVLAQGYLFGFTGVVTFKKSDDLREIARRAPSDRILVETDAPYLAPEPIRKQKTNEPALAIHTAAVVASARGVGVNEIDQITTQNVARFFGWEYAAPPS
jgi:TatD DNase family protein